jgi:predicted ATPase
LVAVFSSHQVAIEQPELHLHPALQACLGDVMIDAMNSGPSRSLLIETHSEHLLLRVLKRIRQSSGSRPIDPSLRCGPEDVNVLYFEPQPDGTSRVMRLRVNEDGEFLDRWPRGFFAERDRELFDE